MRTDNSLGLVGRVWKKCIDAGRHLQHLVRTSELIIVGAKQIDGSPQSSLPIQITVVKIDHSLDSVLKDFACRHLEKYPGALRRFEYCLQQGYPGLACYLDGTMIGYGWWVDHMTPHPHTEFLVLPLATGDIYAFDLFVAKEFRELHRGLQFLIAGERYWKEHGYKRVFSTIRTDNRRSLRVHHQWGWHETGRRTVFKYASAILRCGHEWRWRDPVWF